MRYLITIFLALLSSLVSWAQVPAPGNTTGTSDLTRNWIINRSFDENGNIISEGKKFFDNEGKPNQIQFKRKILIGSTVYTHVFANQVVLDELGRPALTTLSAPINYADFSYQTNFITKNSTPYSYKNYDRFYSSGTYDVSKTNNPDVPDNTTVGTLGWYYSVNNTWEPYTATTGYPFTRVSYYNYGGGGIKKTAGIGEPYRTGAGHELSSYTTPVINELDQYLQVRNKYFTAAEIGEKPASLKYNAVQSGGIDANGKEAISIADVNGNTLMVARPGNDLTVSNTVSLSPAYRYNFQGNAIGQYATNLRTGGSGNIKVWSGTSSNPYTTLMYNGPASSYYSGVLVNLPDYYTIESSSFFSVSYSYIDQSNIERALCVNCPAESNPQSYCYFKLLTSSVVNIGSGFLLYDMRTELPVSFVNGAVLGAGYYKMINYSSLDPITLTYSNSYTDISYFFYNQLGQLIASIPPEGVKKLLGSGINSYATRNDVPFISTSELDVQGRLVKATGPDAGYDEMVYRKDGKLRFSQNAEQRTDGRFAYIIYDGSGRPVESGEYKPLTGGVAFNADMAASVNAMRDILEDVSTTGGLTNGTKTFVLRTSYDAEDYSFKNASLRPELESYFQNFLRGGVSYTEKLDDGSTTVSKTWFGYDEQDRIVWMIKYVNGLGYKTVDYTYDALGKVTKIVYQKGTAAETFAHYYEYDANNELWKVYTNTVDNSSTKTLQAKYTYYLHGGLKRTELATNVQGIDYTYNLFGALKAINNSDKTKDPGGDGSNGFLTDAFGMVVDYFTDDYLNARSGVQPFKGVNTSGIVTDSYNGQIKAVTWFSKKPVASGINDDPAAYVYKYDDKNWFTESIWGNNINFASTPASFSQTAFNKESIYVPSSSTPGYDANGNIRFLQRTDNAGTFTDKFTYNYLNSITNTGSNTYYNTNKLYSVVNDASGTSQTYATYTYDNNGQLVLENTGNSATTKYIKYDITGKVLAVARDVGFTQKIVEFLYDETGKRVLKKSYNSSYQLVQNTFYVGGTVYTQPVSGGVPGTITAQEYQVSGANGRAGIYFRPSNIYAYELADHLGNARAIVAKSGSSLDVRAYSDFYPYGMTIREYKSAEGYRYGYQGRFSEKDGETNWNAFEKRMYDGRIAKWLTMDPSAQAASPYVAMGNNPVTNVDPDGAYSGPEDDAREFASHYADATVYAGDKGNWLVNYINAAGINVTRNFKPETFKPWEPFVDGITILWDWYKESDFTFDASAKVTFGAQIGAKIVLDDVELKAEAGAQVYEVYEGKVDVANWDAAQVVGNPRVHNFAGIGVKVISNDFQFGAKYDYNYEYYNGYSGPTMVPGTARHDWEVNLPLKAFGPKGKVIEDVIEAQLKPATSLKHANEKTFYGIDLGASAKLLLGIDLKLRIGLSH